MHSFPRAKVGSPALQTQDLELKCMWKRGRECSGKCHVELKHSQNGQCMRWTMGPMVTGAFHTIEICLKNFKSSFAKYL